MILTVKKWFICILWELLRPYLKIGILRPKKFKYHCYWLIKHYSITRVKLSHFDHDCELIHYIFVYFTIGSRNVCSASGILDALLDVEEIESIGQTPNEKFSWNDFSGTSKSRLVSPPTSEPSLRSSSSRERSFKMFAVSVKKIYSYAFKCIIVIFFSKLLLSLLIFCFPGRAMKMLILFPSKSSISKRRQIYQSRWV